MPGLQAQLELVALSGTIHHTQPIALVMGPSIKVGSRWVRAAAISKGGRRTGARLRDRNGVEMSS